MNTIINNVKKLKQYIQDKNAEINNIQKQYKQNKDYMNNMKLRINQMNEIIEQTKYNQIQKIRKITQTEL